MECPVFLNSSSFVLFILLVSLWCGWRSGVQFIERCSVNHVTTNAGRVTGVETSLGHIKCGMFVNCAGMVSTPADVIGVAQLSNVNKVLRSKMRPRVRHLASSPVQAETETFPLLPRLRPRCSILCPRRD